MRYKTGKILAVVLAFIIILVCMVILPPVIRKYTFVMPETDDFSLEISYDESTNTFIGELENKTDNDYFILTSGERDRFIDLRITCGDKTAFDTKHLLLGKGEFKKRSVIRQKFIRKELYYLETDLYDMPQGKCTAYCEAEFQIEDPKTEKRTKFVITSEKIEFEYKK